VIDSGNTHQTGLLPERTVLVHDYLNQYGGAERVLEVMHDMAPNAPVYASMYAPEAMPDDYRSWDIRTTWIRNVPGVTRQQQRALPLYPLAFERLRVPNCDLVLSSSSAFAKMVAPPAGAAHVSYVHSPMRFAWNLEQYVLRERLPDAARIGLRPLMALFRQLDRATLDRVDRFVANSTAVRDRIRAFWRRDAAVIHPPVDVEGFRPVAESEVQDYFLMVSRLVPYKRFDLAIEACNALGLPLWIVGDGRDRAALEAQAGPTVRFLGRVSDEELRGLYARSRAALFMSEDDFGIAQVEAQAAGRPVVAFAASGVFDTVIPDVTGTYVREQTVESLIDALRRFERTRFDRGRIVAHAALFSRERFERELAALVHDTLLSKQAGETRRWN
jgi:glycosyltransferase involved in cell wall biosynthesis